MAIGPGHVTGNKESRRCSSPPGTPGVPCRSPGTTHCLADPFREVVVEANLRHIAIGIFPTGETPKIPGPPNTRQALLAGEVQDIKLVDPGRDHNDGRRPNLLGDGCVMDQFKSRLRKDDLARRGRQIPPTSRRRARPSGCCAPQGREKLAIPMRLSPPVCLKRWRATGPKRKKLVGAVMLSHLRNQKAARLRSQSESP